MRVLLAAHRFPPDALAGVERYTEALAGALAARGDVVEVAAARREAGRPGRRTTERRPEGFLVHRLPTEAAGAEWTLAGSARLEWLFEDVCVELLPDVLHVNHLLGLAPRAPLLARRLGAAVVVSLHDFWFACPLVALRRPDGSGCEGPDGGRTCAATCFAHEGEGALLRWTTRAAYFRRLLALADRVLVPSEHSRRFFSEHGVDPGRLELLPYGLPAAPARRAAPPAPGAGPFRLVLLGSVVPHKGQHVAVEAVRLARLPSVRLTLAGELADPGYAAELRRASDAVPGLELDLPGPFDPGDVPALLDGAHAAVVPSLFRETYSLVAREALAAGVPVLASRIGALPEAVRDGVNGALFGPGRPAELASTLVRLHGDPALRERLRDGAVRTPVPGLARHVDRLREAYADAVAHRRAGGPAPGDEAELAALHDCLVRLEAAGAQASPSAAA